MRFWHPEPDVPQLFDWWLPLVRAGRRARLADLPWLIAVDEWELLGRVQRRPRPDVWVYVHCESGRELFVDDSGDTYRFIPNSRGPSPGRFTELPLRYALWQAGLPDVAEWICERRPAPPPELLQDHEDWFDHEGEPPVQGRPLHLVR